MSREALRILIIDDEPAMRALVRSKLEAEGFDVDEAESGQAGLDHAASFHPHLIVLDLGLPDIGGLGVLKRLRQWTTIPILILTVTDDPETKVELLDAGADDYLSKPFSSAELLARVRVALRNRKAGEATPVFTSGQLTVDLNAKAVTVDGHAIRLTTTEFEVLKVLVREHGKVVSQQQLLKEVWGPHSSDQNHYLRIYIAQLRKKIEVDPSSPVHILTEPGVGYRLT